MNSSPRLNAIIAFSALATVLFAGSPATQGPNPGGQPRDTGVRGGAPGAGGSLRGLPGALQYLFNAADATFNEIDSVQTGLGPGFNMNSCVGCHGFPAAGGSSPQINPQVAVANLAGATNTIPSFITASGPVREARFKLNPDGTADGGVHDLFVITGRADAPRGCKMAQTDFAPQVASGNVSYRIPTPVFGAGLIEAIPDSTILANEAANASAKSNLGISGRENRSGNDGTITRFGWKAQNKSLLIFAGEAYNVEQGVTNEVFPNSRQTDPACDTNGLPEDHTDLTTGAASDTVNFALFMRLLAPPQPVSSYGAVPATSIQNGGNIFRTVGCPLCHTPSLTTGESPIAAISKQNANLFSDLLVHNMGSGLADGISQGNATGNEFRTAPLWGVGQRIFFLHDGRTADLMQAIQAHSSSGSEANGVVRAFNAMSFQNQQDLLNFLRSL